MQPEAKEEARIEDGPKGPTQIKEPKGQCKPEARPEDLTNTIPEGAEVEEEVEADTLLIETTGIKVMHQRIC
jgi:hypothetical protein